VRYPIVCVHKKGIMLAVRTHYGGRKKKKKVGEGKTPADWVGESRKRKDQKTLAYSRKTKGEEGYWRLQVYVEGEEKKRKNVLAGRVGGGGGKKKRRKNAALTGWLLRTKINGKRKGGKGLKCRR